ncbi:hypothetical protein ACX0G9_27710 [Flavitalea flava]
MRILINTILKLYIAGLFAIGCKRKLSPAEGKEQLQEHLKSSMLTYLQHENGYDSTRERFEVLDVTYYEDHHFYICEFTVRLLQKGRDTSGIMTGTVSKDFLTVRRKS